MKTGILGILGLLLSVNVQALTISEPLQFDINLEVNVADLTCADGPFRMQRLMIKVNPAHIRQGHAGILSSTFSNPHECSMILKKVQGEAVDGKISLPATIYQATVLKIAGGDSNTCEGGQQEIVSVRLGNLHAYDAIVDVEQKLDCPAGLNAQWVQNINGVIFILHNNGIPTAPKL